MKLKISVDAEQLQALRALAKSSAVPDGTPEEVLAYVVGALTDGVRRPGSWERECVRMLFGYFGE